MYISSVFRFRILGIPTALDFIPYHPNRNGRHYWCSVIVPELHTGDKNLFKNYKAAKIFRYVYSRNNDFIFSKEEMVPELFRNSFIKDVTAEYLNTSDVCLRAAKKLINKPRHGYLSVFNERLWQPVAIGQFKNEKIEFENMGRNILYLPVYYCGKRKLSFNYPFILNLRGEIQYLIPDKKKMQQLLLFRKYPYNKILHNFYTNLNGVSYSCFYC